MRFNAVKVLTAGFIAGVFALALNVGVKADSLDAEIPCAGISIALNNYIDTVDNSETQIVALLPEKVEKVAPARNAIFNNMAIAFVDNYVNVRKKPTTESKIVGKIYSNCSATIIEETSDGWYKIESGNVTGYIKSDYFLTGLDAEDYAIENGYVLARVKEAGLRVRKNANLEGDIITNVYENEVYAVEKLTTKGKWGKLLIGEDSYGNVIKGWVSTDYIEVSVNMDTAITLKEEKEMLEAEAERQRLEEESRQAAWAAAQAEKEAEQSASSSNSSSSSSSSNSNSSSGDDYSSSVNQATSYDSGTASDVVAYAKKFLGNPYVYGGSSLTNGTDCSGFTMSVYKHFGYNINRSSYTQIYNGTSVNLGDVKPGDLVFYKNGGSSISHVAMYIGGGQIIHASTEETGIIISSMYGNTPCAARRIIN